MQSGTGSGLPVKFKKGTKLIEPKKDEGMTNPQTNKEDIFSKYSLKDKVAIVTGGGAGIGEGIALNFGAAGASVVVAELNPVTCEAVAQKLQASGTQALPIVVDVTNSKQVQQMVEQAVKKFGRIDILVNNAGGVMNARIPMLEMPDETWDAVINLNLRSVFLCCKYVGRVMREQKRGSIINIASGAIEHPFPRQVAYGAAKAGVIHLSKSLAIYLAPFHIRVNCVAPGPTADEGDSLEEAQRRGKNVPLGRCGSPEDMALATIYLASDAADFVTGATILVNGGPVFGSA